MSDKVPDMIKPYVAPSAPNVTDVEYAALLAQTIAGETYASAALYQRYEVIAKTFGERPASIDMLCRRLSSEGWRKGRKRHGTVRVWTRPEDTK